MDLLERADELDRLRAAMAQAAGGAGAVVVFEGHAGIGKSALLDHAASAAADAGLAVLRARGLALESTYPFGVARQLLEPLLADPGRRAALLAGPAALAEPALGGGPLAPAPAGDDVAFPLLHGLHWLIVNVTAGQPLALLVDDAQWADAGSLRWLAYLAARLDALPLVLVVAAHPANERPEAETALTAIAERAVLARPCELSRAAAAQLLAASLGMAPSAAFADACHHATGGNPFLLRELARGLQADTIVPDDAGAARVRELRPATVTRSALARLARLGPDAVALARGLAVLGDGTELGLVARAAALEDGAAAQAADRLADAGLLRRERPPSFVHGLVAAVVRADVGLAQRSAVNAAAARDLHATGAPAAEIGGHLLEVDPARDGWVVARLEEAALAAAGTGSPEVAVRLLERALREPPAPEHRGRLLLELGSAQARTHGVGSSGAAVANLSAARERLRDADPLLAALCGAELGQALLLGGDAAAAVAVLLETLDGLAPEQRALGLLLQGALGIASYASPEARRRMRAHPPRRFGVDGEPRDAEERATLATRAVEIALHGGTAHEALAVAHRSLPDGGVFDDRLADSPHAYNAAFACLLCDDLATAREIHTQAIDSARRRGSLRALGMAATFRSRAALLGGDVAGAIADGRMALDTIAQGRLLLGLPAAVAFTVEALIEHDALDEADALLVQTRRAPGAPDSILVDACLCAEAALRLAQGRAADALALARRAGRRQEHDWDVRYPALVQWRGVAAQALAALDSAVDAQALAAEDLRLARAWGGARTLSAALRVYGVLAGDVPVLHEAVAVAAPSQATLEHARALVELGGALRRDGERMQAREPLRRGLALARRAGATRLAAHAHAELEASGVTVRKMLRGGRDALTASELRVARMAADGMANRDIAAALFVTVRTVEAHLRHAYAKLGISGRADLTRALRDS